MGRRGSISIWCALALLLASLNGAEPRAAAEPEENEAAQTQWARIAEMARDDVPALVIWSTLHPLSPSARALQIVLREYQKKNTDQPVAVRFMPGETVDSFCDKARTAELPPDAFLLPGAIALRVAEKGLLAPIDELAGAAGIDRLGFYPIARRSVSEGERMWALPIFCEATLRYANTALAGDPKNSASRPVQGEQGWQQFRAGAAALCDASSNRLLEMIHRDPGFKWEVVGRADGAEAPGTTFETLAFALSSETTKSLSAARPFAAYTQTNFVALDCFWSRASKLPVRETGEFDSAFKSMHYQGEWLDKW